MSNAKYKKLTLEELQNESHNLCQSYEKEHGPDLFIKLAVSSVSRLLIKKGLVTERELIESFLEELDEQSKS